MNADSRQERQESSQEEGPLVADCLAVVDGGADHHAEHGHAGADDSHTEQRSADTGE